MSARWVRITSSALAFGDRSLDRI